MKMSCPPEGGLKFGVFKKKGKQLKYISKGSTHTPSTLCEIPSEFLNRLAKFTSYKINFHSERVENVYPNHTNTLR